MKLFKVILLLLIAFFISITLTSMFYVFYVIDEIIEYDVDVKVGEGIGFNLDPDAIHFGTMPAGNKGVRYAVFNNNKEKQTKVSLNGVGEIKDWLVFSDNNFVLKKGQEKRINITMYVPKETVKEKHEGKLRIYIKKSFIVFG